MQLSNVDEEITEIRNLSKSKLMVGDYFFYKVTKLAYDKDYPHREAFENILLSLDNPAYNFVYILQGTNAKIDLYIGIVKNKNNDKGSLSCPQYAGNVKNIFEGNFNGSELKLLNATESIELLKPGFADSEKLTAGIITGIPSVNDCEKSSNDVDFQGIDRLINSMLGLNWRLVIVNEPVSKTEILKIQDNVYNIYNNLAKISKLNVQLQQTKGTSVTDGTNESDSRGRNWGTSDSHSNGRNNTSKSANESHADGKNHADGENEGHSQSVSFELANKHAQELMKYIDEELLERLKIGLSKGLFKSCIYYMAENPVIANRLKVGIMSLFQGNKSSFSPLCAQELNIEGVTKLNVLSKYQNQYQDRKSLDEYELALKGRPYDVSNNRIGLDTFLTAKEISLVAGLPQTEVPGITLVEGVGFGLNEKESNMFSDDKITLGKIVQRGRVLDIDFTLSKKALSKHTFIAGVTGTGKTTTCHAILAKTRIPFLVLEPAKTEYRALLDSKDFGNNKPVIFTLGNETVAPFRLNPFEMVEGEILSSHIDMVKATFTSAFPMEASMPQLLEEAMVNCYIKYGWDIDTNENTIYGKNTYEKNVNSFPILSDLLAEMKEVVDKKGFSNELKSNYIGSLVSRLSNLTVGAKGNMLNCNHSTDFNYIAKHNVIIEMESLKSPEDKSLFMGFILTRLSSVIRAFHQKDSDFRHITLVEEAHRLLSKVEYGDSGSKKTAVETFTDLLAEVRKYGEGLVIIDQIPNKLAPDVLKNTNTKIIHKILAKDDKETVGDTMLMDDKQKEYLSALETGNAIVFTEETDKPVHVKIEPVTNTNGDEISDDKVKERFNELKSSLGDCYREDKIFSVLKLFNALCEKITKITDDLILKEKICNRIEEFSNEIEKSDILRVLFERKLNFTGKRMRYSYEQRNEAFKLLIKVNN